MSSWRYLKRTDSKTDRRADLTFMALLYFVSTRNRMDGIDFCFILDCAEDRFVKSEVLRMGENTGAATREGTKDIN